MASFNRANRAWRMASAMAVLVAVVTSGALSASAAARRSRAPAKKPAAAPATSAKQNKARPKKLGEFNAADDTVNMFEAMKAGQIEVKLIPKDSTQGRVFIQNKTKKPLNVKLPEAFAATPVLAQMGMGGMGMGGMGAGGGGGQGMGGGMGGMGGGMGGGFFNVPQGMGGMGNMGMGMGGMGGMNGMGGMGMGGGFFNVPAEKEGNFKVPCMCLEHGKPEPRPAMAYKISPIESLSKKPGVEELCRMLGYGKISQRAAQVAAWHLNNDMSWAKLAAKRIEHADGSTEPYFTDEELRAGIQLANLALSEAGDRQDEEQKPSPGETVQAAEASLSKSPTR